MTSLKSFVSRYKFSLAALVILLIFLWSGQSQFQPLIGKKIPALPPELTKQLTDQGVINLENKHILLVFFATWCGICRVDSPFVNRLQRRLNLAEKKEQSEDKKWLIIAISEEEESVLQNYIQEKEIEYLVIRDPLGALHDYFGVSSYPTKVWIDRNSKIEKISTGFNPFLAYSVFYWMTGRLF